MSPEEQREWLRSLKVGDKVVMQTRLYVHIGCVEKITKEHGGTIYVVRSDSKLPMAMKFSMTGGYERGASGPWTWSLRPLTPEIQDQIDRDRLFAKLGCLFERNDENIWPRLQTSTLREVWALLDADLKRTAAAPSDEAGPKE